MEENIKRTDMEGWGIFKKNKKIKRKVDTENTKNYAEIDSKITSNTPNSVSINCLPLCNSKYFAWLFIFTKYFTNLDLHKIS